MTDPKVLFDLSNPTHKALSEVLQFEGPFTPSCPEIDSHIAKIEKDAEKTDPFAGFFGFARTDKPEEIMLVAEWRRVENRVFTYINGKLDEKVPEGSEIIDEKYFIKGMKIEIQEDGNFKYGDMGFTLIRQPNEKPFRQFDTAEPCEYQAKEALCIGRADKAKESVGYYKVTEN
jgi:hypothetical protein